MKIVFMGTPEFSVPTLEALINSEHEVIAVVTQPDKKAGRGQKVSMPPVKQCALQHNIPVLQPEKMKDPKFFEALKKLNPDIQVVVAFRMLPESIWSLPRLGTFNLHTSLLPNYRGAAPINWAIINGETKTGISTFMLDLEIDTGAIIYQEEIDITPTMNAGELHDKMMEMGPSLVLKTIKSIESGNLNLIPQDLEKEYKPAPKIFKEDTRLSPTQDLRGLNNKIRGLSPYPGSFFDLIIDGKPQPLKVFEAHPEFGKRVTRDHQLFVENKRMGIQHPEGILWIEALQWPGKRRMKSAEFVNGFKHTENLDVKP